MTPLFLLFPAALAALLSFLLTPLARWASFRLGAIDLPDPRKVHLEPMPRLGGLAVLLSGSLVLVAGWWGSLGPYARLADPLASGIVLGLVPVAAVSLLDDIRGVRARWKALVHLLGAAIAVYLGVALNPEVHFLGEPIFIGVAAAPLSILWIVGVTSAFNLVDGLDGLSAGLALISAASLAAIFGISGQPAMAASALVLAGALFGFLPWNAYPAKIFLGDTGACSIGFILACFALKGGATLSAGFATVLPILVLGLPVAETLISMMRRLLRRFGSGEHRVFVADRDHIHHRLLSIGLDHRKAVLVLYGVGASLALAGLISLFVTARHASLILIAFLLAAFIGIKRLGYDEFAFFRRGVVLRIYEAPVMRTALFAAFFDLALVLTSYYIARGLKYENWALRVPSPEAISLISLLLLVSASVFWACGMYRGSWRLASLDDVGRCAGAVTASAVLMWGLAPRFAEGKAGAALFAIYAVVAMAMICGARISYRFLQYQAWKASVEGDPILIYGAGHGGVAALRELRLNARWRMRPVGFVDDDPALQGKLVLGLPVLGKSEEIGDVILRHEVRAVAVASAKIPRDRVEVVRSICKRLSMPVYRFDMRFDPETTDHEFIPRVMSRPGRR